MKVMNPRLAALSRRLDRIWRLLAWFDRRRLPAAGKVPASILVVDLHLVGDMVMLIPLLQALRRRFPAARINLLAGPWSAPILAGVHAVDEVVCYVAPWVKPQPLLKAVVGYVRTARALRRSSWDVGIDVRGDVRQILLMQLAGCRRRVGFDFTGGRSLLTDVLPDDGQLHHILDHHERIADHFGAGNGASFVPALRLTAAESERAARETPFVGFHFGASLPLRRLPAREAAELIAAHAASHLRLVCFEAPDLADYLEEVLGLLPSALRDRIERWRGDLREFVVTTSRAERMFVMDSGPAHIAAGLGRDTVVFFGPNLPRYTGPRGAHVQFVEDESVLCRPCDQRHCTNPVHQACMLTLVGRWQAAARMATQPTPHLPAPLADQPIRATSRL